MMEQHVTRVTDSGAHLALVADGPRPANKDGKKDDKKDAWQRAAAELQKVGKASRTARRCVSGGHRPRPSPAAIARGHRPRPSPAAIARGAAIARNAAPAPPRPLAEARVAAAPRTGAGLLAPLAGRGRPADDGGAGPGQVAQEVQDDHPELQGQRQRGAGVPLRRRPRRVGRGRAGALPAGARWRALARAAGGRAAADAAAAAAAAALLQVARDFRVGPGFRMEVFDGYKLWCGFIQPGRQPSVMQVFMVSARWRDLQPAVGMLA